MQVKYVMVIISLETDLCGRQGAPLRQDPICFFSFLYPKYLLISSTNKDLSDVG